MNGKRWIRLLIVVTFTTLTLAPSPTFATIATVYDNTTATEYGTFGGHGLLEHGDQITLAGTERYVNLFLFGYEFNLVGDPIGDEKYRVRFYENDGPGGAPGTMLWETGLITHTFEGTFLQGLNVGSVLVPDTFTWTVQWQGTYGPGDIVGLRIFDPPTLGSSDNSFYWLKGSSGWTKTALANSPSNFMAKVGASPIPEPATLLLFGSGLAGLGLVRRRRRAA